MRNVYDTWTKTEPSVSYERQGRYATACAALGVPDERQWHISPSGNWLSDARGDSVFIAGERDADTDADRIELAIELGFEYGGYDGDHHKMWVIDQMLRLLLGDGYESRVEAETGDEDGPGAFRWDTGIAP